MQLLESNWDSDQEICKLVKKFQGKGEHNKLDHKLHSGKE